MLSTVQTVASSGSDARRVLVVSNTAWSLSHFRLPLMRALREAGLEVSAVSPRDDYVQKLLDEGFRHLEIRINSRGRNPAEDMLLALRLHRLFRRERPDLVLTYTAKPNIYGSLAAHLLRIPVITTIPGLGHIFASSGPLEWLGKTLYRGALKHSDRVFFQNRDDLDFFVSERIVSGQVAQRIPGSGVDTETFSPAVAVSSEEPFVFLHVSRLIWQKGIREFVEASRIFGARGLRARFRLLGFFDPDHPEAIGQAQVDRWVDEGLIEYLGGSDDVASHMRRADCVVLPSYYGEGVPRVLLEGASLGKPLIAADSRGSRDIVEDGVNGFLCKPKNPIDLADRMEAMLEMDRDRRTRMGLAGRAKVRREFDERIVIARYLEAIGSLLPAST